MLTGTPLDLTPFGAFLQGIGIFVLLLVLAGLYLALRLPKSITGKVISAAIVLALFGFFPAMSAWQDYKQRQQFDDAYAHFQARCKGAGEKVSRIVDNVAGVVWMKWRPKEFNQNDQYRLNDPYGQDCGGEDCVEGLLTVTQGLELDPTRKMSSNYVSPYRGFRFVESTDPSDGKLYRYERRFYRPHDRDPKWATDLVRTELVKTEIAGPSARYGITWEDLSTREDRDRWIAGSSLKVIDLQTNEVIAERIGYMFDRGLGNQSGGRQPWSYAAFTACPEFGRSEAGYPMLFSRTRMFIWSVVRPSGD